MAHGSVNMDQPRSAAHVPASAALRISKTRQVFASTARLGLTPGGVAVAIGALCVAEIDAAGRNGEQLVFLRARPDVFLQLPGWGFDDADKV